MAFYHTIGDKNSLKCVGKELLDKQNQNGKRRKHE